MSLCSIGSQVGKLYYLTTSNLVDNSDVKLISVEGECFYTSRVILSSASIMFHVIFIDTELISVSSSDDHVCVITEYSANHLRNVLDFITRGLIFLTRYESGITDGNCLTDPQLLSDFLAFGIDLSGLELSPIEDGAFEKYLSTFDQDLPPLDFLEPIDLIDVKLEQLDEEEIPVKFLRKKNPKKKEKQKKLEKKSKKKNPKLKNIPKNLPPKNLPKRSTRGSYQIEENEESIKTEMDDFDEEEVEMSDSEIEDNSDKDPDFEMVDDDNDGKTSTKTKATSKSSEKTGQSKIRGKYNVKPLTCKLEGQRNPAKTFQCPHCIKGFNCSKTFKLHVLRHEAGDNQKVFFCFQCGKETCFPTAEELKQHKLEFHIDKTYTCDRCGKVFNGNYYHRFKQHLSDHDNPRKYFCVACGFETTTREHMSRHRNTIGPFHNGVCALCPEEFKTWQEHQRHANAVHGGNMPIKCGLCAKSFDTIQRQRIHRRDDHFKPAAAIKNPPENDKSNVVCQFCGKLVKFRYYDHHLENKHSTGQLPCPHCDKILNHPTVLERHIANNHNSFPCEKCGKRIRNRQALRLHNLSVHTPQHLKPHQCLVCDPPRGFHTKKGLTDHMNVHTNERPYKCNLCGASFNNDANMFAHIRSTHKGIKRKK